MVLKPRSSKAKTYSKRKPQRKMMKKLTLKKPIVNSYVFKRLGQVCRIQHRQGDGGDVWRIEDPASQLIPQFASGVSWGTENIPGSYYNSFVLNGRLASVQNPTDFTNLYDRYKITGIKVTFLYQINNADAGGQNILPTIMYATDYDDNTPASYTQIRQKQTVRQKILMANKPISIYYKPKKLLSVSDLATNSNALITNLGWSNCDNSGVNHLGLKFLISNLYGGQPATTTVNSNLEVKVTYYLKFKDPQ